MRLFEILKTSYENFSETMQDFLNKSFGGLGQAYSQSSIFGLWFIIYFWCIIRRNKGCHAKYDVLHRRCYDRTEYIYCY